MASANPPKGRGRGRGSSNIAPPAPSISAAQPTTETVTSVIPPEPQPITSPTQEITTTISPVTSEISQADTGFASLSTQTSPTTTVKTGPTAEVRGRSRGSTKKSAPPPGGLARQPIPPDEPEQPDPYWSVSNLKRSEFLTHNRPKRPNERGQIGDEIKVITNYLGVLRYPRQGFVYKYDIKILDRKGEELVREKRRFPYESWLQNYLKQYPGFDRYKIVFDNQARILSFGECLPDIGNNGIEEIVRGPNKRNKIVSFKVKIQPAGNPVDLSLLQNIDALLDRYGESNERVEELNNIQQVLSIALHESCSTRADFIFNRGFFIQPSGNSFGQWDLGDGKALWRGFYSCLVFGKGEYRLMMNLDVKHAVFYKKQPFLGFVQEVLLQSPKGKAMYPRARDMIGVTPTDVLSWLDSRDPQYRQTVDFLNRQCKHLRVRSQDANKPIIYTIQRLAKSASSQSFEHNKLKRQVTVEEYFKLNYNADLQYPNLPTLETTNKAFMPMELVDVEPVRCKKITDEQCAKICRAASMKPLEYHNSVRAIRQNPDRQNFDQDPFLRAWSLNVDPETMIVSARIKPMPTIVYNEQYQVTPDRVRTPGVWEVTPTRFHRPNNFPNKWGLINLSRLNDEECFEFYAELKTMANKRGMTCSEPGYYRMDIQHGSVDAIMNDFRKIMQRDQFQFLLVILPRDTRSRQDFYISFKRLCELELGFGIVTQMIKEENAKKGTKRDPNRWDLAKISNILLKINPKLNGTNAVLRVHDQIERFFAAGHRIMYVGADLSHLVATVKTRLSAVAVVASADDVPNKYFKEIYKQERCGGAKNESIEYIIDLKEIMKSLIKKYEAYRGFPPSVIIFYRDGISQGEFDLVFERELTAIRDACMDLSTAYRPYISYIVVNKRHHTRFYPQHLDGNVPAGTVVDSPDLSINIAAYDFYLASQHGALGTSRPTHYHVLYDDNQLTQDQIQMLTFALCFTYARCTRSVAIPAPVKYADLLALRAGFYIRGIDQSSDTESTISGGSVPVGQERAVEPVVIKSDRVVLSDNILPECPFFI